MSMYIVRPNATLVERSLSLIATGLTPERRGAQIAEIKRLRAADPAYKRVVEWIADAQRSTPQVHMITVPRQISVEPDLILEAEPTPGEATSDAAQGDVTRRARSRAQGSSRPRPRPISGGAIDGPIVLEAPLIGVLLVEMSDQEAARLRRDLPDVLVLDNAPLQLIQPRRLATSAKQRLVPSDLWHLEAIGLTAARKQRFRGSGRGVTVAVLDTGIDIAHPALKGRVSQAVTFDSRPNVWSVQAQTPSFDTDGHGTHVAGLICGEKIGAAPEAQLMSGVLLPAGTGSLVDFVLALEWAAGQATIQIVNISAGLPGYLPEMHATLADVRTLGILPVVAVGNEGRNRTRSPGNYTEVISVGAANRKDGSYGVPGFSSGGQMLVDNHQYNVPDLVAPGEAVYSSVMGGGYEAWDGTSMAAPIVSGVAALILEKYPSLTLPDLEDALLTTCLDLSLPAYRQGSGLVQVKAAL